MQRPSDALLEETKLLDQLTQHNVGCVFNLTEPGEHPYCGTGILDSTGFPYSPEKLMAKGVRHFNYSWPDMTCPAVSLVLDIVQVACHQLNDGLKIAVHCHAGFGRTGIVCACVLIAKFKLTADEAIDLVRRQRPGSIQTALQVDFVRSTFNSTWKSLLTIFPTTAKATEVLMKSIKESIRDQQQLLSVEELSHRTFRWLPKIFHALTTCFAASHLQTSEAQGVFYAAITGLVWENTSGAECTTVEDAGDNILVSGDFSMLLAYIKDEVNGDKWGALETLVRCKSSDGCFSSVVGDDAAAAKEQHESPLGESAAVATPVGVAVAVQLALDWMDTRSDCVIDASCLGHLSALLSTTMATESSASPTTANLLASHVREIVTRQLCKSRLAILKVLVQLIECFEGNTAAQFSAAVRIALSCLQLTPDLVTSGRRTSSEFLASCRRNFLHLAPLDSRIQSVVIVARLLSIKALFL